MDNIILDKKSFASMSDKISFALDNFDYIKRYIYSNHGLCFELDDIKRVFLEVKQLFEKANSNEAIEGINVIIDEITNNKKIKDKEALLSYCENIKNVLIQSQPIQDVIANNTRNEEILQKYYQEGITSDSVRALKQERDNYKEAMRIMFEKNVNTSLLKTSKDYEEYNQKCVCYLVSSELTKSEFDCVTKLGGVR